MWLEFAESWKTAMDQFRYHLTMPLISDYCLHCLINQSSFSIFCCYVNATQNIDELGDFPVSFSQYLWCPLGIL